jgi:hypothetical protein
VCDPSLIDEELICNCLPLCNEVTYDSEIIQNKDEQQATTYINVVDRYNLSEKDLSSLNLCNF